LKVVRQVRRSGDGSPLVGPGAKLRRPAWGLGRGQSPSEAEAFWATVCKTVRPMLSDRCPVCLLSVRSVSPFFVPCLLWPNGWIKIPLGTEVGLGAGHIVLYGDRPSFPTERGTAAPTFVVYGHRKRGPCLLWPNG